MFKGKRKKKGELEELGRKGENGKEEEEEGTGRGKQGRGKRWGKGKWSQFS